MSDGEGNIIQEEPLSDDNTSNTASLGSRVSDVDSGIEDWSDEMALLTNSINLSPASEKKTYTNNLDGSDISTFTFASVVCDNTFDQNGISLVMTKDENVLENIYPMPLEDHSQTEAVRKDVMDENALIGVCGLDNLGNTCFINAALQCLFVTRYLKSLFCQNDVLQNEEYSHEPSVLVLFVERLHELFVKYYNGKYLSLYPKEFHASLARLLPIFGDYKQHDSQEFLSFVLNTLHELFNRNNSKNRIKDSLTNFSLHSPPNRECEDSKRLKIDTSDSSLSVESETDAGVVCEENVTKAGQAWRDYTRNNQSVIIDRFQGQFQSVITCDKCAFVSTTYEPFMFLSLPIPHAMEQQFVITWLPSSKYTTPVGTSVKRFVVTVNKNGIVGDVRNALISSVKKQDQYMNANDVIITEAKNSAYLSVLDDRTKLSFINKNNSLYAVEVLKQNTLVETQNQTIIDDEKDLNKIDSGDTKTASVDVVTNCTDSGVQAATENVGSTWHSCSICLEEKFDEELKVHPICGGLLCKECLGRTVEFSEGKNFACPTCSRYISRDDYENYSKEVTDEKKPVRQVLVPIMFRRNNTEKSNRKFLLFGHPNICSIPSNIETSEVMNMVQQVTPVLSQLPDKWEIFLTDASGLSCGLCDIMSSCTGCLIKNLEEFQVKPGLCITVHFNEISDHLYNTMTSYVDDITVSTLRQSEMVLLYECMEKFADIEYLGESNPWYCPRCQRHQTSAKHMSVTKWPDVLIVHLKRFYYEGNRGCKITCPVGFPLTDLQVEAITCFECNSENIKPSYDLYGCICHSGTLYGGHYTSFTKQPNDIWYYFNDETYEMLTPGSENFQYGYVLFYQRKAFKLWYRQRNWLLSRHAENKVYHTNRC